MNLKIIKANPHPQLQIPTIKVSNEFDSKSVEGRPGNLESVQIGDEVLHQFLKNVNEQKGREQQRNLI